MLRSLGRLRPLALVVASALALTGIHAIAGSPSAAPAASLPGSAPAVMHALNRLAFGPRPGDVARVQQMGLATYIERQLHPEGIADADADARLAALTSLRMSAREMADTYFVPAQQERRERQRAATAQAGTEAERAGALDDPSAGPLSPGARRRAAMSDAERGAARVQDELVQQRLVRAIDSERQLQEVLVDFWFNHFNVFAGKGAVRIYLTEYERDVIRPRVLGTFRDLLGAVAKSPAMLFYLDNWMSAAGSGCADCRIARPDPFGRARRAARGLNENYARELLELHTLGVDGGYTQADIVAVARAFTGWTIAGPRKGGGFVFVQARHDTAPKTVLGQAIGAGGIADGERVLDIVASHPSTARFIATKLARRFVSDDPPAALIDRAARVFMQTRGDLRAVTRAIITSPEFFAPSALRAKVKSPFEFVVSAARATGATTTDTRALGRALRELGQPLYQAQPPTGYVDRAGTWINTGALLARMNVALALAGGRMRGVDVDLEIFGNSPGAIRASLSSSLFGDDVAAATRETMARSNVPSQIAALALGSPDFQRR